MSGPKAESRFHIPKGIWLLTVPQHVLGLSASIYLIASGRGSPLWLIGTYVAWVLIGVLGVGIFYHKYFAHRAFLTYRWIEYLGAYLGSLAGLGSPLGWIMLHNNNHHQFADKDEADVHSPVRGVFRAYMGWQFLKFDLRLGPSREGLKAPRIFSRYYYSIYWGTAAVLFLIHPYAPVFLLFLPGCIHYHVEGFISSFCHLEKFGYRNFETNDNSVNIWWFGLLTWGAGYHNNHHGNPSAIHYQVRPYEIDASRLLVALIPKKNVSKSKP